MIRAAKLGQVGAIQALVEMGAILTCTDEQGLTPLHHACRHGRIEAVKYLVSKSKSFQSLKVLMYCVAVCLVPAQALDIVEDLK